MRAKSKRNSHSGSTRFASTTSALPVLTAVCFMSLASPPAIKAANETPSIHEDASEPAIFTREPILPRPFRGFSLPAGQFGHYEIPPQRITTTLNIDGVPTVVAILGTTYNGVRITHVGVNSLAVTAGLQLEDVLLSLNERNTTSAEFADRILNRLPSGDLRIGFARRVDGQMKVMETRVRYFNPLREQKRRYYPQPLSMERKPAAQSVEALEEQMIALVNADRRNAARAVALAPLTVSPKLMKIAHDYAAEMAKLGFFSDRDPRGRDLAYRAGPLGLTNGVAESAVNNVSSPEEAETLFMSEPPDNPGNRRGHILDPKFVYLGVGVARNESGSLVVVQLFSTHAPAGEGGGRGSK